jgi:DHA2 family multidrug resistance protein-like MFS transporter
VDSASLVDAANRAFVDAMGTTAGIAAAIAVVGALIAAAFLPSRARAEAVVHGPALPEGAAA